MQLAGGTQLGQWLSKCDSQIATSASPGSLLETRFLGPDLDLLNQTLGVGPGHCVLQTLR